MECRIVVALEERYLVDVWLGQRHASIHVNGKLQQVVVPDPS